MIIADPLLSTLATCGKCHPIMFSPVSPMWHELILNRKCHVAFFLSPTFSSCDGSWETTTCPSPNTQINPTMAVSLQSSRNAFNSCLKVKFHHTSTVPQRPPATTGASQAEELITQPTSLQPSTMAGPAEEMKCPDKSLYTLHSADGRACAWAESDVFFSTAHFCPIHQRVPPREEVRLE